jgi:hypothetical protein
MRVSSPTLEEAFVTITEDAVESLGAGSAGGEG